MISDKYDYLRSLGVWECRSVDNTPPLETLNFEPWTLNSLRSVGVWECRSLGVWTIPKVIIPLSSQLSALNSLGNHTSPFSALSSPLVRRDLERERIEICNFSSFFFFHLLFFYIFAMSTLGCNNLTDCWHRKTQLNLIRFTPMYDMFSQQVLTALHRYRDVKFSPPVRCWPSLSWPPLFRPSKTFISYSYQQ